MAEKIFAEVQAPKSWAGGQWQFAGIYPVRFNAESEALVLVSEEGEDGEHIPITAGAGVPILEFIEANTDFVASGNFVDQDGEPVEFDAPQGSDEDEASDEDE